MHTSQLQDLDCSTRLFYLCEKTGELVSQCVTDDSPNIPPRDELFHSYLFIASWRISLGSFSIA